MNNLFIIHCSISNYIEWHQLLFFSIRYCILLSWESSPINISSGWQVCKKILCNCSVIYFSPLYAAIMTEIFTLYTPKARTITYAELIHWMLFAFQHFIFFLQYYIFFYIRIHPTLKELLGALTQNWIFQAYQ